MLGNQAIKRGNYANEVLKNLICFWVRTSNGRISYLNKGFENLIIKNSFVGNFNNENNENKNALKIIRDNNSSNYFNNRDISKHDNTSSLFNINNNFLFLLKNNSTKNFNNINNNINGNICVICDQNDSFFKENNDDSNSLDVNLTIKTNEFLKNLIVNQLNEELNFDNTQDNSYPGGSIMKRANTIVKENYILPLKTNTYKELINDHKTTYLGEFINFESDEYYQIHYKITVTENNFVTYFINRIMKSKNAKIKNPN